MTFGQGIDPILFCDIMRIVLAGLQARPLKHKARAHFQPLAFLICVIFV